MLSAITLDDSVERCRLDSVSLPLPNISQTTEKSGPGGDAAPALLLPFGLCTRRELEGEGEAILKVWEEASDGDVTKVTRSGGSLADIAS